MVLERDLKFTRLMPSISLDKIEDTFRILDEIIDNLDEAGVAELFGGTEKDQEELFEILCEEIYKTLYGGVGKVDYTYNHLDSLTATVEETLRVSNLSYFITSVLPEFEINWHHLEWSDIAMRYNKFCVIAARDHGKSFFYSNAYPIWKMYRYSSIKRGFQRYNKSTAMSNRGFLFSFSLQQAVDLLDICKSTIEGSDLLRDKLYPGKDGGWAKTDIVCKNGARLTVKGFGSSVRGAHPGWIMIDDGLKDNAIYSQTQRQKGISYVQGVIMNMIIPGGQVGIVGTPFHQSDLYGDLKSRKGWHVREYPAIFPDGRLLWKNRYNFQALMDKKDSQGSLIFSREILCRPVTNESSIFPFEVLQRAFIRMENYTFVNSRENFPIKFNKVVTGVDFSISSSIGADYTVIITAGVDDDGTIWLLNMKRFKGKKFSEQLAVLKQVNASFRPDVMMLEDNVFQQIFVQEADKAGLPVQGHTTGKNKYDLKHGLPGLAILFERGKVKIPRGNQESIDIADEIALELSSITWTDSGLQGVGDHDDIGMALFILSVAANKVNTGFRFSFL